jgi:hypothetical protein
MQTIMVSGPVFEDERRRLRLAGGGAPAPVGGVSRRKFPLLAEPRRPLPRDRDEARVKLLAEFGNGRGERVGEIAALARPEAETRQGDRRTVETILPIPCDDGRAFLRGKKRAEPRKAGGVEFRLGARLEPVANRVNRFAGSRSFI